MCPTKPQQPLDCHHQPKGTPAGTFGPSAVERTDLDLTPCEALLVALLNHTTCLVGHLRHTASLAVPSRRIIIEDYLISAA